MRMHMGRGEEEHGDTARDWQGTGPPVKDDRGEERVCGWWRQVERIRDPWIGEPWGQQGPGHRSKTSRGGNRTG